MTIIVGPVGLALTPTYLELAEQAARVAEAGGATVRRAYSPNATPDRVLEAVARANIVIYFGHGTGFPNPFSATPDSATVNGWGLQGPNARGTHDDSSADGTLAYYGEAWIAAHARPAPGFVMIYSNVCYAPGAGEGGHPPSTPAEARQRAGGYARTPLAMGASAVFATDFYAGAAELVDRLLSNPTMTYGDIVRSTRHYLAEGVTIQPHPNAGGAELWLQRSPYFAGKSDYWFSFSGDPTASFSSAGTGRPDALLAAFALPMSLRLQPGEHRALRLGDDGALIGEERWTSVAVSQLGVGERRRLPDQDGAWYRIADGEHAGAWIAESAAVHLPGLALERILHPARVVNLAAATHAGYRFASDGGISGSKVVSLPRPSSATAESLALVDGQLYVRLADGIWADHWLLVSDAVRIAGPVPPAASSAAAESGASPTRSPSAAPHPPALPPPASPVPTATPLPSRAPSPSPSLPPSIMPPPTASVLPTASAMPSATGTPSPSVSLSPSATPPQSAVPAASDSP